MEKDKVTSDDLRQMEIGETRTFVLPDAGAIYSARATAFRIQNLLGCKFRTSADFNDNRLTITKTARP